MNPDKYEAFVEWVMRNQGTKEKPIVPAYTAEEAIKLFEQDWHKDCVL